MPRGSKTETGHRDADAGNATRTTAEWVDKLEKFNIGSGPIDTLRDVFADLRQAGAHMLFLPPYSPDLNPIEQLFAKLKHLIRMAEPRTVEATWRKVGQILDLFAPDECANYLKNSGYASV